MPKQRRHRLRYVVYGWWAFIVGAWVVAVCGNDRTSFVSMAEASVTGVFVIPVLFGAVVFGIRRLWWDSAACLLLPAAYVVTTGQFVMNPARELDSDEAPLRVMSFNVQHGWEGPSRIVAAIRRADPDVVALQECGGQGDELTMATLAEQLPEYTFYSDGARTSGSRLPILERHTRPLDEFPNSWRAVELVVETKLGPVRVVNTHAPSWLPEATLHRPMPEWPRRWGELSRHQDDLLGSVLKVCARGDMPTVLCGDFNMTPVGTKYRRLAQGAVDCFAASGTGFGWTAPGSLPLRRIDYVWAFPGVQPLKTWVQNDQCSDHAAVVADLAVASR